MERTILDSIRWRLNNPTASMFARSFLSYLEPNMSPKDMKVVIDNVHHYIELASIGKCGFFIMKRHSCTLNQNHSIGLIPPVICFLLFLLGPPADYFFVTKKPSQVAFSAIHEVFRRESISISLEDPSSWLLTPEDQLQTSNADLISCQQRLAELFDRAAASRRHRQSQKQEEEQVRVDSARQGSDLASVSSEYAPQEQRDVSEDISEDTARQQSIIEAKKEGVKNGEKEPEPTCDEEGALLPPSSRPRKRPRKKCDLESQ